MIKIDVNKGDVMFFRNTLQQVLRTNRQELESEPSLTAYNECVKFKLFKMPCCSTMLCWLNSRLPTFCPECGASVFMQLKFGKASYILVSDDSAMLKVHTSISGII